MEDNLSDKIKEGLPKLYPEQFIFAKDVKEAVKDFEIDCSEAFDSNELEIIEGLIIKHFGGALV